MIKQWQDNGNNQVMIAEWGRISYNPNTNNDRLAGVITTICNILGSEVADGEETALYDGDTWYILTGDFRKEYEERFPDLQKCLEFYESKKGKYRNSWSTDNP